MTPPGPFECAGSGGSRGRHAAFKFPASWRPGRTPFPCPAGYQTLTTLLHDITVLVDNYTLRTAAAGAGRTVEGTRPAAAARHTAELAAHHNTEAHQAVVRHTAASAEDKALADTLERWARRTPCQAPGHRRTEPQAEAHTGAVPVPCGMAAPPYRRKVQLSAQAPILAFGPSPSSEGTVPGLCLSSANDPYPALTVYDGTHADPGPAPWDVWTLEAVASPVLPHSQTADRPYTDAYYRHRHV